MPPILNIIHLPHRIDREQSYMEEMNLQCIAFKLWPGVQKYKMPHHNINEAHRNIVQDAKDKNIPHVFIAEDDIKFSCKGAWKYYLSCLPKQFDLYCGLVYAGKVDPRTNRIVSENGMSGTQTLYCIHERFYDFFLQINPLKHIDRELGRFGNINEYYVCNPMVCYQSGGHSDNFRRQMNYDEYLRDIKLYGQ